MMPGNASAASFANFASNDAKALRLFLTYSFKPFSSLGGGSPPPPEIAPLPPGCSLNRVQIFSPNEVSLSKTLAIVSLKLVI